MIAPASTPPRSRRVLAPEIMDGDLPYPEVRRALADLDRLTLLLLGTGSLVRALARRLAAASGERPDGGAVRVLDLGTGSGLPAAVLARAVHRRGGRVRMVGVDVHLGHLLVGRALGHDQHRVVASADALPFRDDAFDWTFSTLFFHHFGGRENLAILGEMRRAARCGVAVVDLRRSRLAVALARALFPVLGVGRVARHDGFLSIAQSWTAAEVAELVEQADGLALEELRRRFPFRWSLILRVRAEGG